MNQVSELIIAKNSLVAMSSSDGENNNNQSFHEQIEYLERITTNLHESVMKVRMVPIESVTQKYPRMIRDLSRTLNKKMSLVITGEDTELDRTVVDQIGDPLQHLLRNSADHGLESNEVRIERGKPEVGTIFLNAYQEGNNVVIKVGDDGNGIDTEAVKNKAIERGIVTAEQAENLSQKDIINFLLCQAFQWQNRLPISPDEELVLMLLNPALNSWVVMYRFQLSLVRVLHLLYVFLLPLQSFRLSWSRSVMKYMPSRLALSQI